MSWITLHAHADGRDVHLRSSAINAYWPVVIGVGQPSRPATVVHVGHGSYSEWVRETPAELAALIAAADRAALVARAEIEQEVWSATLPELDAPDDRDDRDDAP